MSEPRPLAVWTIYHDTDDFPAAYTVRRYRILGPRAVADSSPRAVTKTLAGARQMIPPGLMCIPRHGRDDPTIVEVWI